MIRSWRGGVAIVTVLACTLFTCFAGASGAAILTLGALVMPLLATAGLEDPDALGLVTAAGLPDIILAGLLPALFVLVVILIWSY